MSKSEDIIDLILIEDDITEALKGNNKSHPIMIESEEKSISSDEDTRLISSRLKGQFLNNVIESYKAKCKQYIKQRKAECLANYLKQ